jgi:hypothetical protein
MARASIVREMSRVFGVYNIEVDIRHLELIADYMVSGNNQSEVLPPKICVARLSRVTTSRSTARELACTHLLY